MATDVTDTIAGERMELDGEFRERIDASSISPQQWSLVMTAVYFEVENPDDPSTARLVANTDRLPAVEDELERIEQSTPGGGQAGGGRNRDGVGVLSTILGAFGKGDDADDERIEEAENLADDYASRLQQKLVDKGRWKQVCERAAAK